MIILIEPFYGGSHKYLCDVIMDHFRNAKKSEVKLFTMEPKKWHWRMLVSAAHFAEIIPTDICRNSERNHIFFSAMLNVAEFFGLRPDLHRQASKKILYFHENQLEYPKSTAGAQQSQGQRDFGLVYNQVISCYVVDVIVFNSTYNMKSFIDKIDRFINKIPSRSRPAGIKSEILQNKCTVLYVPVTSTLKLGNDYISQKGEGSDRDESSRKLHIIWAHRWEHDKGPETLVKTVKELCLVHQQRFCLSVLGQHGQAVDLERSFREAEQELAACEGVEILQWGEIASRDEFLAYLRTGDIALSTAKHEFLGLSMLEAAFAGCFPLCPKRLSYPEIFPKECLYATDRQLVKQLKFFMRHPKVFDEKRNNSSIRSALEKFAWNSLKLDWEQLLLDK